METVIGHIKITHNATRSVAGGDDETTAISAVKAETADEAYYDLSGRKVKNPTKGIFIKDGKKVILK